MPGSDVVNANLAAWGAGLHKAMEAEMDRHIQQSVQYAQAEHRWTDQTGHATAAIAGNTQSSVATIESTIYGGAAHNLYLERAWFFRGQYAIIEEARSHLIWQLWARIRALCSGDSLGFRFGR